MTDPVRFEIIRHAINMAAQEMCVTLCKSAYPMNIKTRLDLLKWTRSSGPRGPGVN